jgi:hypothetical protein
MDRIIWRYIPEDRLVITIAVTTSNPSEKDALENNSIFKCAISTLISEENREKIQLKF